MVLVFYSPQSFLKSLNIKLQVGGFFDVRVRLIQGLFSVNSEFFQTTDKKVEEEEVPEIAFKRLMAENR